MKRFLGIDYGRKRTGIAESDPLGIFASPIQTIPTHLVLKFILEYESSKGIESIVIGYPMNLDNTPSEGAQYVENFLSQLKKRVPQIPIILEDERFTSKMAFQSLIDSGVKKSQRREKGAVDRVSAAIILQTYLDNRAK